MFRMTATSQSESAARFRATVHELEDQTGPLTDEQQAQAPLKVAVRSAGKTWHARKRFWCISGTAFVIVRRCKPYTSVSASLTVPCFPDCVPRPVPGLRTQRKEAGDPAGAGSPATLFCRALRPRSLLGSAAVALGVAGHGALDTVPRVTRRLLRLVPAEAALAAALVPAALEVGLDLVVATSAVLPGGGVAVAIRGREV